MSHSDTVYIHVRHFAEEKKKTLFARVRSQVPNVSELSIVSRCRRCKSLKEQLLRLFRFSFFFFISHRRRNETDDSSFFSAHRADESRRILKESVRRFSRDLCLCVIPMERKQEPILGEKKEKNRSRTTLRQEGKEIKFLFFFVYFSFSGAAAGAKWEEAKGMGSITPRAPRDSHRVASCLASKESIFFCYLLSGPWDLQSPANGNIRILVYYSYTHKN